ncbi:MAG: hypothetical protein FWC40_00415 [Proteobacteria bacterium]|nr:hypothetical protein [Pseudomonadota bacterium]
MLFEHDAEVELFEVYPFELFGVTTLHSLPHPPQLLLSLVVSLSQPSLTELLQLWNPGLHVSVQTRLLQLPPEAFGLPKHELLHEPQWFSSVAKFASQPSSVSLLQSAYPKEHASSHVPSLHVPPLVLGFPVQALLQVPQCSDEDKSASQPLS